MHNEVLCTHSTRWKFFVPVWWDQLTYMRIAESVLGVLHLDGHQPSTIICIGALIQHFTTPRITQDQCWEISSYLHFADNATLTLRGSSGHYHPWKVRPVIDHSSSCFSNLYDWEVAIDEAMIKFTGCSSLKQYMPMKPIKRGIKVWQL